MRRLRSVRHCQGAIVQRQIRERLIGEEDYFGAFKERPCSTPKELKERLLLLEVRHPRRLPDGSLLWEFY